MDWYSGVNKIDLFFGYSFESHEEILSMMSISGGINIIA